MLFGISETVYQLIGGTVLVGIVTAGVLYRAAHAKREVILEVPPELRAQETVATRAHSAIHEKIQKIPLRQEDRERAAEAITRLVEEEAEERTRDLRQQYSVKMQLLTQEKNKEVETVRRDFQAAKEKVEEVEQSFKRIQTEKKTTDAVVRSIADGLVVVNQKGEVLLMNPAAEKILGVKSDKKLGRPISEDLGTEHLLSMTRDAGDEKVAEFVSKDENTKKVIRSSSAVIQNEDGQPVGMVNILTDITKQKELDEVKKQFVSNVTHELRTPIVAMQKAVEILLDRNTTGALSDVQQNFLNIVARNLGHLSRLVEDLLDIAKIESGKMRIKMVPARIDRLAADACDSLQTWARSKDIEIIRELEKGLPELSLDPTKITQVLNNLLGNAIKFTPKGGKITVGCSWYNNDFIKVFVADTGVGIAKENLAKLFGRFEQFGDLQGISGTGLGLCISKEITERHGGKIWAESEEKKGAVFTFALPLKPSAISGGN